MEVAIPLPPVDFNFDSACSSPYMTAPSSPQRFGNGNFFFSAPTTPTRAASFYYDLGSAVVGGSEIPFMWEEKPGVPKSRGGEYGGGDDDGGGGGDEDFEFDFSGQLERTSLSADELFDCGKIRPLKPPPCHRVSDSVSSNVSSPRSPGSSKLSQGKKMVQEALSPRHYKKRDFDPFEEALKATREEESDLHGRENAGDKKRGRERTINSIRSSSSTLGSRNGSRSLSPLRVSDIILDPKSTLSSTSSNHKPSSFLSSFSLSKGNRRWRIRDFLLFRSASEGRATEMKNSSFRSIGSLNSPSSSRRRGSGSGSGSGSVSAHELHYKTNRAVSEELRKKTTLPYKHGLLGCLGFNSSMHTSISRGIGSLTRA